MERYYSDTLCQGLRLIYFQSDSSKFAEGVQLLEMATANEEPHAFYFLARCYGWGDGNVKDDERKAMGMLLQMKEKPRSFRNVGLSWEAAFVFWVRTAWIF